MNLDDEPDARAWLRRAHDQVLPMIRGSALTMTIVPEDPDPKAAIELGYTLLLDKPLILVVPPGRTVPDHLVRAADAIVEWSDDNAELARRTATALKAVLGE